MTAIRELLREREKSLTAAWWPCGCGPDRVHPSGDACGTCGYLADALGHLKTCKPEGESELTEETGPFGTALRLETDGMPNSEETVCSWLITAPSFHPLWSQYLLAMVRLRDGIPGFQPPVRQFPGATHELLVVTLNPEHGPYDGSLVAKYAAGNLPVLTPVNVAHQIEGTDAEADELARFGALGIVHGQLEPESSNGPERIREGWLVSMTKTLAHIRNEAHAS